MEKIILKRIRDLREDQDYTQQEIANKLNIKREQYRRYETGENEIPVRILKRICEIYQISADYILELPTSFQNREKSMIRKERIENDNGIKEYTYFDEKEVIIRKNRIKLTNKETEGRKKLKEYIEKGGYKRVEEEFDLKEFQIDELLENCFDYETYSLLSTILKLNINIEKLIIDEEENEKIKIDFDKIEKNI